MNKDYYYLFLRTYWNELKRILTPLLIIGWIGGWYADILTLDLQKQFNTPFRLIFTVITSIILLFYLIHAGYKAYLSLQNTRICFLIHRSQLVFSSAEISPILEKVPSPIIEEFDTSPFHSTNTFDWNEGKIAQEEFYENKIHHLLKEINGLYYIGIVEIPFAIHLGFLVGDSIRVRFFHRQRPQDKETGLWEWPSHEKPRNWDIKIEGLGKRLPKQKDVNLIIQQSALVDEKDIDQLNLSENHTITISVPNPSIHDIVSENQIFELGRRVRSILDTIKDASSIHLFAAVPPPIAFYIGQNIKETMHPPVIIYWYDKREHPSYQRAMILNVKA